MVADSISLFSSPLAQAAQVTNWLTPVWMIAVGVSIGFILAVLGVIKIVLLQKVSLFNTVQEKTGLRLTLSIILGLVYLALFLGFLYWRMGPELFGEGFVVLLGFALVACLLLGFGAWSLVSKRMIGETWGLFTEGFLGWLNYFCLAMVVFAGLGFFLAQFNGFGFFKPVIRY